MTSNLMAVDVVFTYWYIFVIVKWIISCNIEEVIAVVNVLCGNLFFVLQV